MSGKSGLLCALVFTGGVALAQTIPLQPNQNQAPQQNQPPRAPGQIVNGNAEPTPPPLGGPGFTADPTTHPIDDTGILDKQFIMDVALRGMRQIEVAKIAIDKTSNPAIKQYAQKVVREQGKATGALKRIAGKQSITIPDSIDTKQQADVDRLAKLSGEGFDRAYMKDQVRMHERSLRDFQREVKDGRDDSVKQFAARVLPLVEQHLQTAKDLAKSNTALN
ncbi:MAG: outer membrane protein [Bryobacterales bacterium]|nr:outer membrane protein [Bryobacterales bacterium]